MKPSIPKNKSSRIFAAVVLILAIGLLVWWLWKPDAAPQFATSPVTRGDLQDTVEATGTVEAFKIVSVGAQVSGQIEVLNVELGDKVKAEDLIAEIDSRMQRNDLSSAKAELENIKAQRAQQQAELKKAELEFTRQAQMLAGDATSRADYESAEADLNASKASIAALDAQLQKQQTAVGTAETNLGYTKISAPMDGTVVAIVAEEGQTVNANQSTPTIVKLANLDTMTVNAEISEADVIKVEAGQTVYFTILGDPDKKFYATLRTIEPAPTSIEDDDSSSSSSDEAIYYNALFDVDNADGILRIDMTAQVTVVLDEAKDVLMIPTTALGPKGPDGGYMVRVVNADGLPEPRKISVGLSNDASIEVRDGLEEGDQVIVGDVADNAGTQNNGGRMGPGGPPPMM